MSMLTMREPGRKVLATGAAWGGVRAMVAMKLSGFNVAADFNGGKTSQPFAEINS